ncbi:ubiquinone biosynthesis O-methyltransferase, mitochondrial [Neocloeon triangulifer]|uniref:ubiquinone biosynthesis O-methyltransferase, mitochondrial n=1 Tax=Neocloeon triangulifer TaxID=2078957 RepID=UPI00286F5E6D|nr:ubiquinone biosynthesis O-methyltransferase, mitochondrial [Neocloeon triangulifer]
MMAKTILRVLLSRPCFRRQFCTSGQSTSINPEEIKKFDNLSSLWWDEAGEFRPLHSMNSLRIPFIRNGLVNSRAVSTTKANTSRSLDGLDLVDVGCGGGILSEPLARIGANVLGLDASQEAIQIAKQHSLLDPNLSGKLQYRHGTLEELAEEGKLFDAVIMSEVVEHMNNPQHCFNLAAKLVKPNGSLFVTTLNRSYLSWLGGILIAERLLKIVPPGTHDWDKFLTPLEVENMLADSNCNTRSVHGMAYNILTHNWHWTSNVSINYALHAVKSGEKGSN